MSEKLNGKVAVVTGAASGIGLAATEMLLKNACTVVMTDRNDLGGISTPMHPQVEGPAVFIYDGMPGGAGLTRQAFERADELVEATLRTIADCPCELGCPSCVHSPKCGSGNRPIDKRASLFVLEAIRSGDPKSIEPKEIDVNTLPGIDMKKPAPGRYGVLDIETRYSADEVGGWSRADRMGVSIACVYDSKCRGCSRCSNTTFCHDVANTTTN